MEEYGILKNDGFPLKTLLLSLGYHISPNKTIEGTEECDFCGFILNFREKTIAPKPEQLEKLYSKLDKRVVDAKGHNFY